LLVEGKYDVVSLLTTCNELFRHDFSCLAC